MRLTVNEIVYLLNTWNGWYLIQHDELLQSEASDNEVRITIEPFDCTKISPEVIEDLADYTSEFERESREKFYINFLFSAHEHQANMIFKALRPIIEKAIGSKIEIINIMKFIETDLPSESEIEESLDGRILSVIEKYRSEGSEKKNVEELDESKILAQKADSKEEARQNKEEAGEEKSESGEQKLNEKNLPINELTIRGIINSDYIVIEKILHNGNPFPNLDTFLEACRLFETVERNFTSNEELSGAKLFECTDETEASLVGLYLGSASDFASHSVQGKTIQTSAEPEELATVVSFVRYRDKFSLFSNPLIKRLRHKRKLQKKTTREFVKRSCSCLFYSIAIFFTLLLWLIFYYNKK